MQENGLESLLPENINSKNTNSNEAVNANKDEENQ
jgi:hypothetical protein